MPVSIDLPPASLECALDSAGGPAPCDRTFSEIALQLYALTEAWVCLGPKLWVVTAIDQGRHWHTPPQHCSIARWIVGRNYGFRGSSVP